MANEQNNTMQAMGTFDKAIMRALIAHMIGMETFDIDDTLLETVWVQYTYYWTGEAFALVERAK